MSINKKPVNKTRLITYTAEILARIVSEVKGIEKLLDMKFTASGLFGLVRYKDGNAYEIAITPIANSKNPELWTKFTEKSKKDRSVHNSIQELKNIINEELINAYANEDVEPLSQFDVEDIIKGAIKKVDRIDMVNNTDMYYEFNVYPTEDMTLDEMSDAIENLTNNYFGFFEYGKFDRDFIHIKYKKLHHAYSLNENRNIN